MFNALETGVMRRPLLREAAGRPARRIALAARRCDSHSRVPSEESRPTLVEPIAMRRGRFARVAAPALALLAAVAAGLLTQSAHAGPPAPVVPAAIAVEDGHKPFLVGHAVGVQIYRCNAVGTGFLKGHRLTSTHDKRRTT